MQGDKTSIVCETRKLSLEVARTTLAQRTLRTPKTRYV